MALINCNECGAQISDKATTCPHCGAPVTQPTTASTEEKRNANIEPVHCVVAKAFYVLLYIDGVIFALLGIIILFAVNPPAGIILLVIAVLFFLCPIIALKRIQLSLENGMVTGKVGVINTKKLVSPISKIQSVSISNGLWGKIFHYHTITVSTAGTGRTEYIFNHMTNAQKFVDTFTLLSNS